MAQEVTIDVHERLVKTAAEFAAGTTTYAGRKSAWHKLGNVIGKFASWQEILAAADADFLVFKAQLQDPLGRPVDAWGTFRIDRRWTRQYKAGEITEAAWKDHAIFLGPVGGGYTEIQHTSGFEILDRLVGEIDGAHYETMGTLDKGRIVWGQVDPNVKIRVGDDESDVLLTFYTSHDGSKKFNIFETIHRVVCRNTYRAGSLNRLAASLTVKHTKNAGRKISDLKAEISEIQGVALSMQDRLNFLANKRVTKESLKDIMDRLFPQTEKEGKLESSTRRDNVLAEVLSLYESNDGNAFPEQRGSMYNLLNAVTEYTDHFRTTRGGEDSGISRAESSQFGSGAKLKQDALGLISAAAKEAPEMVAAGGYDRVEYDPGLFAK